MSKEKEYIEALEANIEEYKETIEEIVGKEKSIATVVSGPEIVDGKSYYRVSKGTGHLVVTFTPAMFGTLPSYELKSEDEVVIIGQSIVAVLPKKLETPKEKISLTKLVKWEEIGGIKSQLQVVRQAIEGPMKNAKLAKELGITPIKGILLHGPPGCGKTMIAKAIARTVLESEEVKAEAFTYMKGAEVLAPLVGVAEQRIRSAFAQARKYSQESGKRAILFIDEAEAVLPKRGSRMSSDVDSTIVPSFLAEMDGFDNHSPIVLLATNRPEQLDGAATREGRIDIKVEITRPTKEDMAEMLAIHLQRVKVVDSSTSLATLGAELIFQNGMSHRASGALAATMVNLAASNTLNRVISGNSKQKGVTAADIEHAYKVLSFDNH